MFGSRNEAGYVRRPPLRWLGALWVVLVVGHYVDWNLYRVVYMVDVAGQSPRALEEWRLSPRREGEER